MIDHLCKDKIYIFTQPQKDGYGRLTYLASVSYYGRFVVHTGYGFDYKGERIITDAYVLFSHDISEIDLLGKIQYGTNYYKIVKVEKPKDSCGVVAYTKIVLQKTIQ